jgi:hypothetical protein
VKSKKRRNGKFIIEFFAEGAEHVECNETHSNVWIKRITLLLLWQQKNNKIILEFQSNSSKLHNMLLQMCCALVFQM